MTFYTKSEDGTFAEATQEDIDGLFKDRHDRWVSTESTKIRGDVEKTVREELTPTLTKEIEDKVKAELQPKLEDAEKKANTLEIQLRQKTIAAEYGFKPGTEKYLGEGTEEEMRKEADTLKSNFSSAQQPPEKETPTGTSAVQTKTGVIVKV